MNATHSSRTILYVALSVALSLLIHLALFSVFRKIPFEQSLEFQPERKASRILEFKEVLVKRETPKAPANLKFQEDDAPKSVSQPLEIGTPRGGLPSLRTIGAGQEQDMPAPVTVALNRPADVGRVPAPAIVQIDGDGLSEDKLRFDRLIIPRIDRVQAPSFFSSVIDENNDGDTTLNFTRVGGAGASSDLFARVSYPGALSGGETSRPLPVTPDTRLLPFEKVSPLDQLLTVKMFRCPESEGGGYFRIDITPNLQAQRLGKFKKDIIFVIDVSGSISNDKLWEFKDGVRRALKRLDEEDRFEITAFRDRVFPLFGTLAAASDANKRKAATFLDKLTRSGSTDIYSALEPYVGPGYKTPGRPLLLFLISDGQLNTGRVVNSRALINRISNANQETTSVFTFSCGKKMNTFLMDLLAYRNRGEYEKINVVTGAGKRLADYIDSVADIVVADLDYQVSSALSPMTFPKKMPNLYHDHTLSIYGQYGAEDREVGLRIVGTDVFGERQELVFNGQIDKAESASFELARNWALQYIFHMYSLLTARYDSRTRETIYYIADKFALKVPFLDQYLVEGLRFTTDQ